MDVHIHAHHIRKKKENGRGLIDEKKLGVIANDIVEGMECLVDYQRRIIRQIDELVKDAEGLG